MFPYPSGSGLHIGHFYNYAIIRNDQYDLYVTQIKILSRKRKLSLIL